MQTSASQLAKQVTKKEAEPAMPQNQTSKPYKL